AAEIHPLSLHDALPILIDAQGHIASEMAVGAQALLALAAAPSPGANGHAPLGGKRSLEESKIERNGLAAGTPAPDFRLPLLHGRSEEHTSELQSRFDLV